MLGAVRRNTELGLILLGTLVTVGAYLLASLAEDATIPANLGVFLAVVLGLQLTAHVAVRRLAPNADGTLLPIAGLLNGLGYVFIVRLDEAKAHPKNLAGLQSVWIGVGIAAFIATLLLVRRVRDLERYRWTIGFLGIGLLLLPLVPGVGREYFGARIWVSIGPINFQPGEFAKILLAIFFASYLVGKRELLAVSSRRVGPLSLPRARDLGPIIVAWLASLAVLIFERDLGSSLLFFGLFVAMLYVATERVSWIAIGLTLFCLGAYLAYLVFGHVQTRVLLWLDTFSPEALRASDQLAKGLMGMASGGMFGTGLGRGRPDLTYFAESDFIVPSFGEEIGLIGLFAIFMLYALLVQRGLRTSLGTRDGFGKLLAAGLSFSVALQCFVVVGGVTRVIPLTGLTMPFLSSGGSSLLANWTLVAILLRISDHARRPLPEANAPSAVAEARTEVVRLR